VDFGTLLEILDKHGQHAFALVVIAQMYLFGRELKQHHKELKKHRDDEELTRKELIQIGTAIAVLLDRDKRDVNALKDAMQDVVHDAVEEISGVHPKVDPSLLDDDVPMTVEIPPLRPPPRPPQQPRAKSHPGAPGAYSFVRSVGVPDRSSDESESVENGAAPIASVEKKKDGA
jgi:hypothetical protein